MVAKGKTAASVFVCRKPLDTVANVVTLSSRAGSDGNS